MTSQTPRVLLIHNFYQTRGGEESVLFNQQKLLQAKNIPVFLFSRDNSEIKTLINKINICIKTLFNPTLREELSKTINHFKPTVAHVHNFFPLFSLPLFLELKKHNVPIILTIHNYKAAPCISGTLFRQNRPCEKCLGKAFPFYGIYYRCYKKSFLGSAVATVSMYLYGRSGIYNHLIKSVIFCSHFLKEKLNFPSSNSKKFKVLYNFYTKPDVTDIAVIRKGYYFIGRLSDEKNIIGLITLWKSQKIFDTQEKLFIIGDGPLLEEVKHLIRYNKNIVYLGRIPRDEVYKYLETAKFLISPSQYYEACSMVVVEALAHGVIPIVCKNTSNEELVAKANSGLVFDPNNQAMNLQKTILDSLNLTPILLKKMSDGAMKFHKSSLSEEAAFNALESIYKLE